MSDLISRQAAIEAINELHDKPNAWLDLAVDALEDLPSAQPDFDLSGYSDRLWKAAYERGKAEVKHGEWIYLDGLDAFECSVCGRQMVRNIFDYCPNCGADMRKETEDG